MKRTIIIGILGGFMMSSCSVTQSSYTTTKIDAGVRQHPTVADLDVKPKTEKTVTWNFLLFNYGRDNLNTRKDNLISDMLRENDADILLEPQATFIRKSFGKRSLTVTGYPASLENFRKASPQEVKQLADKIPLFERRLYDIAGSNRKTEINTRQVEQRGTEVVIHAGFAFNNMVAGDAECEWNPGYSAGVEFNTFITRSLYWSAGALFTSRGAFNDEAEFMNHSLQVPIGLGYKIPLSKSISFDAHFAPFFSVDIKKGDVEGYHSHYYYDNSSCDAGVMLGAGFWFKKVNLDFLYQRGFIDALDNYGSQSNLILRLGVAF